MKNAAAAAARQLHGGRGKAVKRPASELTIINGEIGPRNGAETEFKAVGVVVRANIYQPGGQPIVGVGNFDNPSEFPDHNRYGNESGAYNFIAQTAEVEVDRATGEVKVLEIASAGGLRHRDQSRDRDRPGAGRRDAGRRPRHDRVLRLVERQPTDPQLKDYPIPSAGMVPKLHVAFAESYEPSGPFGAKGLGEIGLDAVPAVIANAIADAVGVRIHELPITAEKIHRALTLRSARRGGGGAGSAQGRHLGAALLRQAVRRPLDPEFVSATRWKKRCSSSPRATRPWLPAAWDTRLRRERTGYPQAKRLVSSRASRSSASSP